MPGNESSLRSTDNACGDSHDVDFPAWFLNSLVPHHLVLKVGTPIILLRKIDGSELCRGTRLPAKGLMPNLLEGTIITGCAKGEDVFITRIIVITGDLAFIFKRIIIPVNEAQRQTLIWIETPGLQPWMTLCSMLRIFQCQ